MNAVTFEDLATTDLRRGGVYSAGTTGTIRDEPLHPLVGVGSQGGIRLLGSEVAPRLVVLFSTTTHRDWPDSFDRRSGVVTFHGDNRTSAALLGPRGNRVLRSVFARGFANRDDRSAAPPFLVFTAAASTGLPSRSVRFEGLAVPGAVILPAEDWLVAKWFDGTDGRFENYVLTLTLLDAPVVPRQWVEALSAGEVLGPTCPGAYRHWVESGQRRSVGTVG